MEYYDELSDSSLEIEEDQSTKSTPLTRPSKKHLGKEQPRSQ